MKAAKFSVTGLVFVLLVAIAFAGGYFLGIDGDSSLQNADSLRKIIAEQERKIVTLQNESSQLQRL